MALTFKVSYSMAHRTRLEMRHFEYSSVVVVLVVKVVVVVARDYGGGSRLAEINKTELCTRMYSFLENISFVCSNNFRHVLS